MPYICIGTAFQNKWRYWHKSFKTKHSNLNTSLECRKNMHSRIHNFSKVIRIWNLINMNCCQILPPFVESLQRGPEKRAKNGVFASKGLKMVQQWLELEGIKGLWWCFWTERGKIMFFAWNNTHPFGQRTLRKINLPKTSWELGSTPSPLIAENFAA